jgi:hypothetical protein
MAHDVHHDAHQPPFENVCMTGPVLVGALIVGLAITAVLFAQAFWLHH